MTIRLLLRPEAAPLLRPLLATRSTPLVLAASRLLATGQYLALRIHDASLTSLVLAAAALRAPLRALPLGLRTRLPATNLALVGLHTPAALLAATLATAILPRTAVLRPLRAALRPRGNTPRRAPPASPSRLAATGAPDFPPYIPRPLNLPQQSTQTLCEAALRSRTAIHRFRPCFPVCSPLYNPTKPTNGSLNYEA